VVLSGAFNIDDPDRMGRDRVDSETHQETKTSLGIAIVDRAFEEIIEQMTVILMQELMSDDRNNRHAEAERRFQNGLTVAMRARDRIKELVGAAKAGGT
jgi:hypothetical protein